MYNARSVASEMATSPYAVSPAQTTALFSTVSAGNAVTSTSVLSLTAQEAVPTVYTKTCVPTPVAEGSNKAWSALSWMGPSHVPPAGSNPANSTGAASAHTNTDGPAETTGGADTFITAVSAFTHPMVPVTVYTRSNWPSPTSAGLKVLAISLTPGPLQLATSPTFVGRETAKS